MSLEFENSIRKETIKTSLIVLQCPSDNCVTCKVKHQSEEKAIKNLNSFNWLVKVRTNWDINNTITSKYFCFGSEIMS